METDDDGKRWQAGVSLCVPKRAEGTGKRRLPDDSAEEKSVYSGADRNRKDAVHFISGSESGRGRACGQDFLSDGENGDAFGCKRDGFVVFSKRLSGKSH